MLKRTSLAVVGFAALLLTGAGCANLTSNTEGVKETGPIKVGVIGPYSGDAAIYGEPMKQVAEVAFETINATGGIDGRRLEPVFEDGKCNGKDASLAMQKLATVDQVKFVIGGFCSGESLAAAPIANDHKIVLFSPGSSSPELTEKGGLFFLRNYPSDSSQGIVLAEGAVNKKNWKKIGVMQEQTDYAQALAVTFFKEVEDRGGEPIVQQFTSQETDFRTILTKLKAANVDAIFLSVQTPQIADLILRQTQELNWKPGIIGADVFTGSETPKKYADYLSGNMIMAEFGYREDNPKFKKMVADYKTKFNKDPDFLTYSQTMYDAVFMLKDAIEANGTNDTEAVLSWMLNKKGWEGASGVVEFTAEGDRQAGHDLKTLDKDGKAVLFE